MRNQTVRLFLYSSLAIVGLTLAWGFKSIPQSEQLASSTLKSSLEQELIVLSSAVRSSTQAMRFKLLDILKAEGNDRPTRAFQDSIFVAASLVEWDESFWKPLWHSSKTQEGFQSSQFKEWIKDWPLSKLSSGEVYFTKVGDLQGQAHFAIVVPVRKPSGKPMVGIGVFPANQFGLTFAADRTRDVRIFDDKGMALALSRPAYLGASLKAEPLVEDMLEGEEISSRLEWRNDAGVDMAAVGTRMSDSNLSIAIEAPVEFGSAWLWKAWLYLIMCAAGAVGLNWYVLNSLTKPLLEQITQSDNIIEQLKRAGTQQVKQTAVPAPQLEDYTFIESIPDVVPAVPSAQASNEAPKISLSKVVHAALRSLDARLKEQDVKVQQSGLENISLSGDALQLQTALEEIIKNSLEAMAGVEHRWLTIMGETRNGRAHLTIEDTGAGIAPENLEKVFDPFFSTKDAEGVSRGLGLNVVRRVLEEMEGAISVDNRTETSGARVEIEWPIDSQSMEGHQSVGTSVPKSAPVDAHSATPPKADMRSEKLASAPAREFDLDLALELEDDDEEDFAAMIMKAPLIPTGKNLPDVPVRKPKVRTVDLT